MANFNTRLTKQQIITALTKALESMSEQEVQSAISTAVSGKQDILSFDNTPTSGSSNPVTSGGVYTDQQRQDNEISSKASLNDIYGTKNQLPNGTDLNNLSAGIMMCPGATVAASLLNCPTTTDAFIIYTDYLAASSRAIQRIYSFSTTTGITAQYMRARWSQGWSPWYQVMMQSVASAQSAASLMQAGRIDADLMDDTDNDVSETSGGEGMR